MEQTTLFCPHLFDGEHMHNNVLLRHAGGKLLSVEPSTTAPLTALRLPEDSIV